jgi:pyruvate/2-oxoglutarate dehydrogenase complex dihydrolipoamide dehydrogenase (E3) component
MFVRQRGRTFMIARVHERATDAVTQPHHIVIVGGGAAGLPLATRLATASGANGR